MFSALVAGLDAGDEMDHADDETVEASKKHDRRLDSTTLLFIRYACQSNIQQNSYLVKSMIVV